MRTSDLIVYYSWSENTAHAAEIIRTLVGGDMLRLEPVHAYPKDYHACVEQSKRELAEKTTPKLKTFDLDITQYTRIFIGSPNWCGSFAPPIRSFLSRYDLSGKIIYPFCTHGGGGLRNFKNDLEDICNQSYIMEPLALYGDGGSDAPDAISKWILRTVQYK